MSKPLIFSKISESINELESKTEVRIIIMLVGTKSDLIQEREKRIIDKTLSDFIKENNLLYCETSAKTGEQVNEAFNFLVERIFKKNSHFF